MGGHGSDLPVRIEGDQRTISLDARVLVDIARRVILTVTRDHIAEGRRPDGGPQRPLSAARAAAPGRAGPHRGYKTGHLADELRAKPIKGDHNAASSEVLPPTDRNVFVALEAKRGVRYLGIGAEARAKIGEAVTARLAAMLSGEVSTAKQGEPTAKDEA